MTLLFLLPCSELMHCGNPSQCSPAVGLWGECCSIAAHILRALGSQGQASRANLISLHLLLRGGQPDPGAEVGGGGGSPHLKEQRVLKKGNSGLGA